MCWILVDYERNRRAAKRGAGATRLTLHPSVGAGSQNLDVDLLALDQALDRLAKLDRQQSQIVELRYFGGLSIEDTSQFLGISPATVKRSWSSARVWLLRENLQLFERWPQPVFRDLANRVRIAISICEQVAIRVLTIASASELKQPFFKRRWHRHITRAASALRCLLLPCSRINRTPDVNDLVRKVQVRYLQS
jgi:hypothetical protein